MLIIQHYNVLFLAWSILSHSQNLRRRRLYYFNSSAAFFRGAEGTKRTKPKVHHHGNQGIAFREFAFRVLVTLPRLIND